jgi:phosphoglycerol transferase MdoB-like AlkP superfamily enzyme
MGTTPPRGTLLQFLVPVAGFVVAALALLLLSRLGLVLWQHERVAETGGLWFILLQGLRFDLVSLGQLLALPLFLAPLLAAGRRTWRGALCGLRLALCAFLTLYVLLELVTPTFVSEYDARPNYLLFEYLEYPGEVLSMLWGAYPLQIVLAPLAVPTVFLGALRMLRSAGGLRGPLRPMSALALALAGPGVCVAAARSTLEHRPVNPSTVCFSSDPLVNTLPLNSLYSAAYAVYEMRRHESEQTSPYGVMPYDEVVRELREDSGAPAEAWTDPDVPTLHRMQHAQRPGRPLNLVIVLEESLGAEFVGSFGGLPLTPHLDRLRTQGLDFERLYATGTRSVRGIEAVITGFLPAPTRSVVKLPRAQRGFFTLAELLRRQGYATSFLYGGESHFDNMGRFFTGNGFERVIDHGDFHDPQFEGSWGVCDQDLLLRAHAEFERAGERPFFSLVFTSSNHSPWDFPAGGFELHETPVATRHNAVKYADHALGEFFELARGSSYWDDTVFLVVADHNSRVYGAELVPVEQFHIPGVFLGGSVRPGTVTTLASQVDLVPTALALIGVAAAHPAPGRDLTDPGQRARPGRAFLQYDQTHLYLTDAAAVAQRPGLPPCYFRVEDGHLGAEIAPVPELGRRALASALWPQMCYAAGDYRLP